MEPIFRVGEFTKVRDSGPSIYRGKVGLVVDNQYGESRPLYHLKFPDGGWGFFEESEIEDLGKEGMPCPKCAFEGRETQLSQPYHIEGGWAQDCPVHGRLYIWGWYKVEDGQVKDLLTGINLPM